MSGLVHFRLNSRNLYQPWISLLQLFYTCGPWQSCLHKSITHEGPFRFINIALVGYIWLKFVIDNINCRGVFKNCNWGVWCILAESTDSHGLINRFAQGFTCNVFRRGLKHFWKLQESLVWLVRDKTLSDSALLNMNICCSKAWFFILQARASSLRIPTCSSASPPPSGGS